MLKPQVNNVLVMVLKSGKQVTMSFGSAKPREQALEEALYLEGISRDMLEKHMYIMNSQFSSAELQDQLDLDTGKVDLISVEKQKKLIEIRKYRDLLLSKLDIEFIRILERDDCSGCKEHLVEIKEYLRDVPTFFIDKEFSSIEQVKNFNVFDNVFNIKIINSGSGYIDVPSVTIDPPNNDEIYTGFQMQAVASIKDGSVDSITVTQIGSSYIMTPQVVIDPPPSGEQATAVVTAPENNMIMDAAILDSVASALDNNV